jgi:capsular polysaccharide biosynthesis protein
LKCQVFNLIVVSLIFEIVYAEDYSIVDQIELFREAKNIVGVHENFSGIIRAIPR